MLFNTTILDKIVAKKKTPPYGKIIPPAPVTMLKHEIVFLVTYQPPNIEGWGRGRNTGLQKALILLTQKGVLHNLLN